MAQSTDNPFVIFMLIIIVILGIAITLLANVVLGAAQFRASKPEPGETPATGNDPAGQPQPTASNPPTLAGVAGALAVPTVNGLSDTAFYLLVSVVALEVFIIMALLYNLRVIIGRQKAAADKATATEAAPAKPRISWWDRFNNLKPITQEADLDLGHDYDGIRELDNRLPPWWLYGFYCTILFAGVYLWRYHISHTAPLPLEEYRIAVLHAEHEKAEYLKKAANNIDENSVKLLTAPADLAAGKAVFETTCFACHGKNGEGGVGPNLTDEYWLHGGSISDVFKTIKYGWPDKGMKSWKDDYSPSQIAQLASYVKSLAGTHPANPKPPQGTEYKQ
ncbi:MAG TPA: cbb3-type cytochrome c oxidase N-terminal domain-containing protein [Puia sp.]|uniref:cbb3-type cytochrome c oxidase N-terminal domain-containing protein n=1 Tax=Puia sp. TaxID=2045100 RepID=UPI002CF2E9D6|nr:cbb3-type cytochrome c oxidase N-terminal domain-containing protein [Puia sp.]HVU94146.1 cbb3-type cytochrome c oxidase N-terminal domain-containing protein [Puia sp.]